MFKKVIILALAVFLAGTGYAQQKSGWQINLERASLDLTTTQVEHADRYQGFSDTRLNADTQTLIQAYLKTTADYYFTSSVWNNAMLLEYGKTKIEPADGSPNTTSENSDKALFTTGYAYKMWHLDDFGGMDLGPFINAEYQTEFTSQEGANRKQVFRGRAGVKLFEGVIIKDFYAAMVGEYDITYSPHSTNLAWETGLKAEYEIREGVKAALSGYFRDYLDYSETRETDLDYEAEIEARMDVLVLKNLSVAPFINYHVAQAKYFGPLGSNLRIGISFSFSTMIKAAKEI